ncbi:LPS biosynthesis-related glycosyltransferase [Helicobacter fennelliae]|nr:LPS biosynthesis-related glycosyltransferase [Helicobacter fennelliae]
MINDGSTDESAQIAQEYLSDPRFVLINQENQGLALVRNAGLEYLKQLEGQNNTPDNNNLVGFVDSDDVISKNYFCNLVFSMQAHNVKIAKCSDVAIFDTNHYNAKTFRIRQRQTKGLAWQFKHNKITKAEV